jgi:hypothetical protein
VTTRYPANYYWGIDASLNYGKDITILQGATGIVDTGEYSVTSNWDGKKKYDTDWQCH